MQGLPNFINGVLQATSGLSDHEVESLLPQPVIILSSPRSGSNFLFEQMSSLEAFWTIGGESHGVFRAFPHLRAHNPQLDSMALGEQHADTQTCDLFRRCFLALLKNREGVPFMALPPAQRPSQIYVLEKTPRNALNIPFLLRVFPKAKFIYLHRDPRETVSSLIEAWTLGMQTGRFVTFRDLPDWHLPGWCFLLPQGWRELRGKSLVEIAAFQWMAGNMAIMDGLASIDDRRWATLEYANLIAQPHAAIQKIIAALGLNIENAQKPVGKTALSKTTLSAPQFEKWKRHEAELEPVLPELLSVNSKILAFCGQD